MPYIDAPEVNVQLTYGGGQNLARLSVFLTIGEYLERKGNERELFEEQEGVPWAGIAAWAASDGRIRCCATTKRGRRCRCYVTGAIYTDPASWAKADAAGGYCFAHEQR
jgi:hypothetical protein